MDFDDALFTLASRAPKVTLPGTNLLLDFDAASLALSDGAAVAAWNSSSSAWQAVQADPAHQFAYVAASTLNGKPAVRMGANDYMHIVGLARPEAAGFTVYYVADITAIDIASSSTVLQGGQTALYTSQGIDRMPHAYLLGGYVELGYGADTRTGPLCQTWTTGLSPKCYTGRTLTGSGTVGVQGGLVDPVYLGAPGAGEGARADVARILVFEGIHDEATRNRVWDYIFQEYGVADRYRPHSDGPIAWDTVVLAGQSNALGNALVADISAPYNQADPSVRMWNSSNPQYRSRSWEDLAPVYSADTYGYGCEVSMMRDLAADAGWPHPALYKCAMGSTNLAVDWAPTTGPRWREMVDVYARAVAALPNTGDTLNVRAFVWIQGESDCIVEAHSLAYGANLAAFIAAVRSWLGKPQLPFWLVRLPATLGAPFGTYVGNTIAGQNATAAADPHVHIIDTPLPLQGDNIHWTGPGYVAGGHTLAARIIAEGA